MSGQVAIHSTRDNAGLSWICKRGRTNQPIRAHGRSGDARVDLVLDLADKLGSVVSAVFGDLGLLLTALGLWLPGRQRRRALRRRNNIDDTSTSTGLQIPDRADWVPDSRHLPPHPSGIRLPPGGHQPPFGASQPRDPTGPRAIRWRRWVPRPLVAAGLALLALAVVTLLL